MKQKNLNGRDKKMEKERERERERESEDRARRKRVRNDQQKNHWTREMKKSYPRDKII